jgi:hypothetical protein
MEAKALAKACAIVMWADGKVEEEELVSAEHFFSQYNISWNEAKPLVEQYLDELLDADENAEDFEEVDEELDLGNIDFGEGVDSYEVLCALSSLATVDNVIDETEIGIIHQIARATNQSPELATAALLKAAVSKNVTIRFD